MAEQPSKVHHAGAGCHNRPCSVPKYVPEGRYPVLSLKSNWRALARFVVSLIHGCGRLVTLKCKLAWKRNG